MDLWEEFEATQKKEPTRRSTLICVGVVCALMAAVVVAAIWWYRHPAVDQAQARAMQPVIDAYMHEHGEQLGLGGALDARLKPEVFCGAGIVEIRPDGPRWRVGMMLNCGEFARRGNTLTEGSSGYPSIGEVMVLTGSPGHYRVLSLDLGPPAYDPAWVHQNFSSLAARWMLSSYPPTAPDPVGQARQAFGFAAGTPAVQQ
ncbi:MAG TPA: hypothetical protein VIX15_08025 [Streptosporangiaceae bacterium]